MKSVPIHPPTDEADRTSEERHRQMMSIKVVIDSIATNDNHLKLNLNDIMKEFESYFTFNDLEKNRQLYINMLTKRATKQR